MIEECRDPKCPQHAARHSHDGDEFIWLDANTGKPLGKSERIPAGTPVRFAPAKSFHGPADFDGDDLPPRTEICRYCRDCDCAYHQRERERQKDEQRAVTEPDDKCRQCGAEGWKLDEFTSPYTGLCAKCSPKRETVSPKLVVECYDPNCPQYAARHAHHGGDFIWLDANTGKPLNRDVIIELGAPVIPDSRRTWLDRRAKELILYAAAQYAAGALSLDSALQRDMAATLSELAEA